MMGLDFRLKRGLLIAPPKVDKNGHGAYLSAKAWNSRVLLEWLNDCALRASLRDFPPHADTRFTYRSRTVSKYRRVYLLSPRAIGFLGMTFRPSSHRIEFLANGSKGDLKQGSRVTLMTPFFLSIL